MSLPRKGFVSLLHHIKEEDLNSFDGEILEKYRKKWIENWESGDSKFYDSYGSLSEFNKEIDVLKGSINEQKLIYQNKNLLKFLEDGDISLHLDKEIRALSAFMSHPFVEGLITKRFLECLDENIFVEGVKSIQNLKGLKDPYFNLPFKIQEKIEASSKKQLKRHLENLGVAIEESSILESKSLISRHFKSALSNLPFEHSELLQTYGQRCEYLTRKNLPKWNSKSLTDEEQEIFAEAALLAGEILNDRDLLAIGRKAKNGDTERSFGKKFISLVSWVLLFGIIVFGVYKLLPILQGEMPSAEEKYAEYVRESNNYYRNRLLSLKDIEQRKSTEVVESFQYGEKDDVPLFHTYIRTNKYMDINEIDMELFRLKRFINVEGIETGKIFALVHFFIVDKEQPYREVMVEYSNIQRDIKYKQVLLTRPGRKLSIIPWTNIDHKVNIEVKEEYKNGVVELSVFDLHVDVDKNSVQFFAYDPMPKLEDTLSFNELIEIDLDDEVEGQDEIYAMMNLVSSIVADNSFNYRIPVYKEDMRYQKESDPITPMYNWELTTSDNLAFIRIRSDDVKGYYLIDRDTGRPVQAKAAFDVNGEITKSFFFHWEEM